MNRPVELSEAHHKLVERELWRVLRSLPSGCCDIEDGRAAGYLGLSEAMSRFDPRRGQSFERYARPRVRGAIIDGLRELTPFGRAGYRQLKALYRAHLASGASQRESEPETDRPMPGGLTPELEASFRELQSLATALSFEALELPPEGHEAPAQMASSIDDEGALLSLAFERLTEGDQELITSIYDLRRTGDNAHRFAQRQGISRAAVSQRHKRALKRLKALVFELDDEAAIE